MELLPARTVLADSQTCRGDRAEWDAGHAQSKKDKAMGLILLILIILFLFGGGGYYGYRSGYYGGRGFGGGLGLIVVIVVLFLLFGGGFHAFH